METMVNKLITNVNKLNNQDTKVSNIGIKVSDLNAKIKYKCNNLKPKFQDFIYHLSAVLKAKQIQ